VLETTEMNKNGTFLCPIVRRLATVRRKQFPPCQLAGRGNNKSIRATWAGDPQSCPIILRTKEQEGTGEEPVKMEVLEDDGFEIFSFGIANLRLEFRFGKKQTSIIGIADLIWSTWLSVKWEYFRYKFR